MEWTIKRFDELSTDELYDIWALRNEVFILEQECICLDADGRDMSAYHLTGRSDGVPAAYLRILDKGVAYDEVAVGRVLVKREFRRRGVAREMMGKAMDFIKDALGERMIHISAQAYLRGFYEELGFKAVTGVYIEEGIEHIGMIYDGE